MSEQTTPPPPEEGQNVQIAFFKEPTPEGSKKIQISMGMDYDTGKAYVIYRGAKLTEVKKISRFLNEFLQEQYFDAPPYPHEQQRQPFG